MLAGCELIGEANKLDGLLVLAQQPLTPSVAASCRPDTPTKERDCRRASKKRHKRRHSESDACQLEAADLNPALHTWVEDGFKETFNSDASFGPLVGFTDNGR